MGRSKPTLIKDNSTKDNKDSKHWKNQIAGSSLSRSKAAKDSTGQMNQQLTNNAASSPPPKSTANATLLITPNNNRNSPTVVDGGDDSASFTNVSLNGGNTDVVGDGGDAAMDGGGTNNDPSLVPKSGSDSMEKDAATAGDLTGKIPSDSVHELVTSPKLVAQSTDDSTGDEVMAGDNTTGGVINKDGSALALKSVSNSTATDDVMARLNTKIGDTH